MLHLLDFVGGRLDDRDSFLVVYLLRLELSELLFIDINKIL